MGSLPHIVEDCMGVLQLFSDGSVHRCSMKDINFPFPVVHDDSVDFKDVVFDKKLNISLRLYRPKSHASATPTNLLPVVFYFHGGGFCVGSRVWPNCHNCCIRLASGLDALVVAPDYRLAPEHKLPAALDDAVSAVEWLQREALMSAGSSGDCDAWLGGGLVDFDRVYVVGDSSGGNMAHHVAVRLGSGSVKAAPVRVRGYVLLAPFFGGEERTKSEEGPPETFLNLEILDRFWRLSMPKGESRDHPMVNPFGPISLSLKEVDLDPILVMVGGNEMLKDRVEIYSRRLKELGKEIEYVEFDGQQHGFLTNDPYSEVANEALQVIKRFMIENSN
ncbi:PREDICTED: probable carboxylesterase 15 [Fragaria vesca subsp. vesca]|uniref:probable carboxylesterase 15 n=1 Tax=Fragaria vesca subsp. vesca TaxID=101020 RepID=UPI0002C3355F|nr:PREDICTED: probable carboxylesterase 15 [Fragaria vesca subsp. vesca]